MIPCRAAASLERMVIANSLVTVPPCCSAPGSDNKSTLNEAPMPRGFTEKRCDAISLRLPMSLLPPSLPSPSVVIGEH